MPSQPVQSKGEQKLLSIGNFGSLSERLSTMRHDINNRLAIVTAAADLMKLKPDAATIALWLPRVGAQPEVVKALMQEFSESFERQAALIDRLSLVLPKLSHPFQKSEHSQKEMFIAAMRSQQPEIERLEQLLDQARRAALEAALAQPLDEGRLRELALHEAEIEIELTLLRARALASIHPPLTEQQRHAILRDAKG